MTTICMSQENLKLAMPFARIEGDGKTIKNPKMGVPESSDYLKNVTMFCRTLDGEYKKIVVYNAMHEGGISAKAVQKAEGELALEFAAHYTVDDLDGDLWQITDVSEFTMRKAAEASHA